MYADSITINARMPSVSQKLCPLHTQAPVDKQELMETLINKFSSGNNIPYSRLILRYKFSSILKIYTTEIFNTFHLIK